MDLFREAFASFCDEKQVPIKVSVDLHCRLMYLFSKCSELVDEYEIGVHFCGNLKYLPKDVAELAIKVVERTKRNKKQVFVKHQTSIKDHAK